MKQLTAIPGSLKVIKKGGDLRVEYNVMIPAEDVERLGLMKGGPIDATIANVLDRLKVTVAFDDWLPSTLPEKERDVHTEHCCKEDGCKYGNADCTVETGAKPQSFKCGETSVCHDLGYYDDA